jgi:transglutaminase-like putative cysteine protease
LHLLLTNKRALLYTQTMEISSAPNNASQLSPNDRLWDWRAALFAITLVEISSTRLVFTDWAPFLYFTQTMGFFGVILGLALGYSNFSRQAVIRLTAGYTFILLPAQLLNAVDKTEWLWQDVATLFNRLFISLDQFIKNKPVDDHLFFISIVTLLYWGIGLSAGYWLTRHKDYLNVVLPSGLAILTIQAFDSVESKHIWEFAFFIFISLLLLGRMYFLQNRSFWKKTQFLLTDEAVNDLERAALAVTAIVVFVAWSLPGWIDGIKPAAQAWEDFSQPIFDKFSNAVSALDSPYTGNGAGGDFYGNELALGKQAATGNTQIFTVEVKETEFVPVRSYWKGRTYDRYLNGNWTTDANISEPFLPTDDELTVEYPNERHLMEYTFTNSANKQSLLYTPAETVWVSKKANILSTPISAEVSDVTAWVAATSLLNGSQYKVRALIAGPSIEELRATGVDYPDWVAERYLQVPGNIAPQLSELALEITAPYDTVYDKVQAVTSYLRSEIKYETTLTTSPPNNLDPVLWVIFEHKKGFCMYYASAETLMLRSIGIPARMSVGFVEGAFDELEGKYVVTYKDSHAWPEVYFPGIGWVEFEPTVNQFPIERPETNNEPAIEITPEPNAAGDQSIDPLKPTPLEERPELSVVSGSSKAGHTKTYGNILTPVLILLTFGLGVFIIRRYSLNERLPVYLANQYERRGNSLPRWVKRWVGWINLSPVERAFQAVNLSLFWLGHPQPSHITSKERVEALINHLPSVQDQALLLLQEYHNTLFTPRAGNVAAARKAAIMILLKTRQFRIKETLNFLDTRYNQLR